MKVTKKERNINMIWVVLLLVVMPLGSYYYMTSGYNYFKRANAELGDFGKVPAFEFVTQDGKPFTQENIKGKIVVSDFIFTACPVECPRMSSEMARVQEAFKDADNVLFLSHTIDPKNDSLPVLKAYAERYGAIENRWFFLRGDKQKTMELARKGYKLAADENDSPDDFIHSPHLVLVDDTGTILKYYDTENKEEIDRLVIHISMMLPKKKKADIEFKREKEM